MKKYAKNYEFHRYDDAGHGIWYYYTPLYRVEQAIDSGDDITGCTVHYVNEELDGGEIILQGEVPILPDDTVESLTKAIQRKEYALLPTAIEHVKHQLQK